VSSEVVLPKVDDRAEVIDKTLTEWFDQHSTTGDGDMVLLLSISDHIHGKFDIESNWTCTVPWLEGMTSDSTKWVNKVSVGTNRGSVSRW